MGLRFCYPLTEICLLLLETKITAESLESTGSNSDLSFAKITETRISSQTCHVDKEMVLKYGFCTSSETGPYCGKKTEVQIQNTKKVEGLKVHNLVPLGLLNLVFQPPSPL